MTLKKNMARIVSSLLLLLTPMFFFFEAKAGPVLIFGSGGNYSIDIKSMRDMQFDQIVAQEYDFSCGSAALATLLSYHYDLDTPEDKVLMSMYEVGDQEKIRSEGFSMLDMKKYLQTIGFSANGYNVPLDKFSEVGIPAIVLINSRGYLHFVVIKGITDKEVLLGDPALGMTVLPRDEFESMWNGIIFVIDGSLQTAKANFNKLKDWKVRHRFPLDQILDNGSLAGLTVNTMFQPGYY